MDEHRIHIPVAKYRKKVRARLEVLRELFADRPLIEKMFRKVNGLQPEQKSTDFHNKMELMYRVLEVDIPALLDAFDKIQEERQRPSPTETP